MKSLYKAFIFFLVTTATISFANPFQTQGKINLNNTILTKVNNKSISVMDVMKNMDIAFLRAFPDLIDSPGARYQFYTTGWKQTLDDMINNRLILEEAENKEIQLSDGEVREEMENRFGPNIILTLEKLNLSYEEAFQLLRDEMVVQRMSWFFIQAKAIQKITPQTVRGAYRIYCIDNPPVEKYSYNVLSIRANDETIAKNISDQVHLILKDQDSEPNDFIDDFKGIEAKFPKGNIQISKPYALTSKEISSSQKDILDKLNTNSYSGIICQKSRSTNKNIYRIFYLNSYEKILTPTFEEMSNKLHDELLQKAIAEESQQYFKKLRKTHGFDENQMDKFLPKDFQPFIFE